jgi:hypothetical protein
MSNVRDRRQADAALSIRGFPPSGDVSYNKKVPMSFLLERHFV